LKSNGIIDQFKKLKKIVNMGAIKNIKIFDKLGTLVSLFKSFKASAKACNNPYNPTILGPRLRCIDAKILRSMTVKKAIENNKGNTIGTNFKKSILKFTKKTHIINFKKNVKTIIKFTFENYAAKILYCTNSLFLNFYKKCQYHNNYL